MIASRWRQGSLAVRGATLAYLDTVVSRIVLFGAAYLTAICLLPDILRFYLHVPFYLGGLSFLILVSTVLDFDHQITFGRNKNRFYAILVSRNSSKNTNPD